MFTTDMASDKYLISAAIDFGTTYSGYAFSTRNDFKTSPLNASCLTWTAGSGQLQSFKTSSSVLFNADGEFDSFGFEAEDKYSDLVLEDEHKEWYLFRRFKMALYKKKNIKRDLELKDMNGKQMPALKVFSAILRYLKNHLLGECAKQGFESVDTDIHWVLTVPAIWSEPAKQFMREAAINAGLPSDQLILALEPEAASLFCKHQPVQSMVDGEGKKMGVFRHGTKYMVLDAGGGTIDVTVHQVQKNGTIREIHKASGGNWGGTSVDEEFESLLSDIVGEQIVREFKNDFVEDVLELYRSFEMKKRSISKTMEGKITFNIPSKLLEIFEKHYPNDKMDMFIKSNPKYSSDVTWYGSKLRLSKALTLSLFARSLGDITDHLQQVVNHASVQDLSAILMVGGYSECSLLQDAVKERFPHLKVIVPREAGLAVLKGAVITGHCPNIITERISRYTYGVACRTLFNKRVHKEEYKVVDEVGVARCDNVFKRHVAVEESVTLGKSCETNGYYCVSRPTDTSLSINIYASTEPSPMYTTDKSCQKLGTLKMSMPDTSKGLNRGVEVSMSFGGTEIEVEAVNIHTKKKHTAFFDFLG
ncbi:heat shock 70 kDa protein 12B-like [Mizuhopecten yessoensis]|uniref:Heat shock 70 kDa protein n=1 Tax=Mizuhopecten yessoensis TaxID=6573 RepID=A0A1C9U2W5_MIZYE|nr:heat shock 70 kDa protein 12B-like [Mizuhopecten yessoensis]XP_021346203.1 heat shock 70 kDa protein 12B-like [Mizuhopecten yessoensis]AOR17335.1 heat shock 70 kDa protein [Mizuhopecten yessoensis]OWF53934.1 Heat shock 70 kDa protein 12B [Mizuhopecten yessoensis]